MSDINSIDEKEIVDEVKKRIGAFQKDSYSLKQKRKMRFMKLPDYKFHKVKSARDGKELITGNPLHRSRPVVETSDYLKELERINSF